jgi:D-tyrosyl-tRNA(Tyr) deacylase
MRALIQRVTRASVTINGNQHSSIASGLLVLLGIEDTDTEDDISWLSRKIVNLRIFNDSQGVMNLSLLDINGELMIVSQFTLHASTKKGNRPSYIRASKPDIANPMYERFVEYISSLISNPVKTGVFGADMKVDLLNDGPVTIWMDSKNPE